MYIYSTNPIQDASKCLPLISGHCSTERSLRHQLGFQGSDVGGRLSTVLVDIGDMLS